VDIVRRALGSAQVKRAWRAIVALLLGTLVAIVALLMFAFLDVVIVWVTGICPAGARGSVEGVGHVLNAAKGWTAIAIVLIYYVDEVLGLARLPFLGTLIRVLGGGRESPSGAGRGGTAPGAAATSAKRGTKKGSKKHKQKGGKVGKAGQRRVSE